MDPEVEQILAQRAAGNGWGPGTASLAVAGMLHFGVAAALLILPRLNPPPPPQDYVDVQVIPAQALGALTQESRSHRLPEPAPPPAAPAPPAPPKATEPEPRPEPPPVPVPEAPVLPVKPPEKPVKTAPAPTRPPKPKPKAPEPPDNRFDPTTRPKVVPSPRQLLAQRTGRDTLEPPPEAPAAPENAPPRPGAPTGSAVGTAAVGSSIAGLDNPDFTYDYYIAQLLSSIDRNWTRPPVGSGVRAVISFHIQRDGSIADLAVRETSGFDTFDLAALRAVQNASPFPPLPRGYRHETLGVNLIVR